MVVSSFSAPEEFAKKVRDVLLHLYDPAYLQNHPLALLLDNTGASNQLVRAQRLRRLILDSFEALQPPNAGNAPSEAARAYAVLTYRYVYGHSIEEIEARLALSRSQVYRVHAKAVDAVASVLWDNTFAAIYSAQSVLEAAGAILHAGAGGARMEEARAEVSRLEGSKSVGAFELYEILEGVVSLMVLLSGERGIPVVLDRAHNDLYVTVDRTMLRQAIMTLVGIALANADDGVVRLAAEVDTGSVIHIANQGDERANPPPASREREMVDLAVAQQLVEALGGRLETGLRGGRWWATIALAPALSKTVLIIDDNLNLVSLFRRYVGGYNVSIVGVSDSRKAVELSVQMRPQLIVLDLMLPGRDGWEILQDLRREPSLQATPIVVCSVLNEPKLAAAMGANDYLTKPVEPVAFLEVLHRWLGALQPDQ